jgi:uncharacterized membrane protein YphA (DoxX/SURF4 family)
MKIPEHLQFLAWLTGGLFIAAGIFIAVKKNSGTVALYFGWLLLLFFLVGHVPNRLGNSPAMIGLWTDALKLLALAGGAFVIAENDSSAGRSNITATLKKTAFSGRYLFALMLIIFGIDHFLYIDFVKTLVPSWIPGKEFWAYTAGVLLIGSGLAIFIRFKLPLISGLTALMLFLWLVLLHIPRALTITGDDGNEIISVMECLAFTGIALMLVRARPTEVSNSLSRNDEGLRESVAAKNK